MNHPIHNSHLKEPIYENLKNDHKKIPIIKKNFKKGDVFLLDTNLEINKNNNIKIINLILKDSENFFQIDNVSLNKKFELNDFKIIKVKTKDNNKVNNDFIIENKKSIKIKGSIFDASILLEEIEIDLITLKLSKLQRL